jgi:hypothetical protein
MTETIERELPRGFVGVDITSDNHLVSNTKEHELIRLTTDYGFYTFKVNSVDVVELENEKLV